MTWVVLTKSQLLRFKATFGSKIKKDKKFKVTKFERPGSFNSDVINKKSQKWRNPQGSNRVIAFLL